MNIKTLTNVQGISYATTNGLVAMGHLEMRIKYGSGVGVEDTSKVLTYISDYLLTSGQRIQHNETMRYGWSTLRFNANSEIGMLTIEELEKPLDPYANEYIEGVARSVAILNQQDATVARNGIIGQGHHPHRTEMAVICRHIRPDSTVMVLDRIKTSAVDDSGWFIGCGRSDHNHNDPNELARIHLVYIVESRPNLLMYMAMPDETRVVLDRNSVIVFSPGESEGRLDEVGVTQVRF